MKSAYPSGLLAVLLFAGSAGAQTTDADADAERLFREGQRLLEARRFGEACPKFEAAYQKDHQLGTLLNLAFCHKEQGAVWQSWLEFKEAELKATEMRRSDRRDFARARMAELERSLARLVVVPHPSAVLVDVLVEDRRVPGAETGAVFAAEPGQRKITFRAKGKRPFVELVTVVKSDRPQRLEAPEQEDEAPASAGPAGEPSSAPTPPRSPAAERPSGEGSTQKTLAVVLGGAGAVGVGVGAVFGAMVLGTPCASPGDPGCTPAEREEASDHGAISTASFIVGGGLLAGAAVLLFTAPSASAPASAPRLHVAPEAGLGWAGLRGTF